MTNNNTDQEKQWADEALRAMETERTNPSSVRAIGFISGYLAGRQQAQVEVDQWEYTYKAEIHRQNMMGEAINNHQREIQKLREQNNNLSNSYDDLWAKCADESYWIEENKKLREQLKEKDNEIVKLKNHYSDELKKTRDHFAPWGDRYQELKLELQKEQLCTQFYADRSLYIEAVEGDGFTGLPDSDCTRCEEEYILWGGKQARETIKNRKVL